jgi:hypothetical protein
LATEKDAPVFKARLGRISVSVWENHGEQAGGETTVFHTVKIERSYRDKEEKWQSTPVLTGTDVSLAIALLQKVEQDVLIKT